MNYGLHIRPRPINRDMQRQLGWRPWGFFTDFAVRPDDDEVLRADRAPDRTAGVDQNVSIIETDTEMAVEIDDTQTFQNRNALGQFLSERRFAALIRVHGSQCPPAFRKQSAADNHGGTTDAGSGGGVEPPRPSLQKPQRIGGNERQRGHAENGSRAESEHISDGIQQRVGGRREDEQSGRTRRAVHHANHKCAPETQIMVCVAVRALRMRRRIVEVGVGVYVAHTVLVLMNVEMRTLPPKPAQNISTEKHKHRANRNFEHGFCPRRDALAED